MRLVADVARRRQRHRPQHLAVVGRLAIEVDDGEEVGRDVRLVARPHVERRRFLPVTAVRVVVVAIERDAGRRRCTVVDATSGDRVHSPCRSRPPRSMMQFVDLCA